MSVNRVMLVGRLGADPELKFIPTGDAVANLSVATSEQWKDKEGVRQERTEWHKVVIYRKLAEIAGKYLKKGSLVYLEGKNQTRKWQAQDGADRYTTEVVVHDMKMLGDGGQAKQSNPNQPQAEQQKSAYNASKEVNTHQDVFDDDIPF